MASGLELYDKGDWGSAVPFLTEAALRGSILANFKLGNALTNLGQKEAGAPYLRIAAEAGHAGACNNYARYLEAKVENASAGPWYRLAADSGDPTMMLNYAFWLNSQGSHSEYLDQLRMCSASGSKRASALLGDQLISDGLVEEGLELLEEAIDEGSLTGYLFLARRHLLWVQWEDGLAVAEEGLTAVPEPGEETLVGNLKFVMAYSLLELGRLEEGLEQLQESQLAGFEPEVELAGVVQATLAKTMMDKVSHLQEAGELAQAEDLLVGASETATGFGGSEVAARMLIEDLLIPESRLFEAKLWALDLLNRASSPTSDIAFATLGWIEYLLGDEGSGVQLLKTAETRGIEARAVAAKYLEMIKARSNSIPPIHPLAGEYDEGWKEPTAAQMGSNLELREQYEALMAHFQRQGLPQSVLDLFEKSPASSIHGLASGIARSLSQAGLEFDRQAISKACYDFIVYEMDAEPLWSPLDLAPDMKTSPSGAGPSPRILDFVTTMHRYFTAEQFEDTYAQEYDALFKRVVWEFEQDLILTYAPGEGLAIQEERKVFGEFGELASSAVELALAAGLQSTYELKLNGLKLRGGADQEPTPREIVHLIELMTSKFGAPVLHLPWLDFLDRIEDEREEIEEELEELDAVSRDAYTFFFGLDPENQWLQSLPWQARFTPADWDMPEHSAHGRFYKLLDSLEVDHGWIILNSECCASCAAGSLESIREADPSRAGAPSFVVFEQNADSMWGRLGWVAHLASFRNDVEEETFTSVIEEVGLELDPVNGGEGLFLVH